LSAHRIIFGDALEVLRGLDAESVDCCVTSPPYFRMRDYNAEGQIGLEETPEAYVQALVAVFAEVRRVLKPGATLWVNIGDKHAAHPGQRKVTDSAGPKQRTNTGSTGTPSYAAAGLKPKDLIGLPWMLAFALRADGWWLRQDIIWAKGVSGVANEYGWHGSTMSESAMDRPTTSHEHVLLLSKKARCWYDYYAAREDGALPAGTRAAKGGKARGEEAGVNARPEEYAEYDGKRNMRSVWTIQVEPQSYGDEDTKHFAAYPQALVKRILVPACPPHVCAECGVAWEHRVEKTKAPRGDCFGVKDIADYDHGQAGSPYMDTVEVRDLGYHPACACGCSDLQPGDWDVIATPTGERAGPDPTLEIGRAGYNRPRGDAEGTRSIYRYQQRQYAEQLRASPHRGEMQGEAGMEAFAHYIRTDASGARPIAVSLLDRWLGRGWLREVAMPGIERWPPTVSGIVLDPFLGSGTTTEAARRLRVSSIGIELNREYEAVMRQRFGTLHNLEGGITFEDADLGVECVQLTEAD